MNEETKKKIEELEARVLKLEQAAKNPIPETAIPQQPKRNKVSVGEFLKEKKPSTTVHKALVFAAYHELETGKDTFNTDDILSLWRQAKETPPANINDLINKNIKKGYMAEEKTEKGQKKMWYVTSTGNEALKDSSQENHG